MMFKLDKIYTAASNVEGVCDRYCACRRMATIFLDRYDDEAV